MNAWRSFSQPREKAVAGQSKLRLSHQASDDYRFMCYSNRLSSRDTQDSNYSCQRFSGREHGRNIR